MSTKKKSETPASITSVAPVAESPAPITISVDAATAARLLELVSADGKGMARQVLTVAMQRSLVAAMRAALAAHEASGGSASASPPRKINKSFVGGKPSASAVDAAPPSAGAAKGSPSR